MAIQATRSHVTRGRRNGRTSLEQEFRFTGDALDVAAVDAVLFGAPLVGERSIFGPRPGTEVAQDECSRQLRGFSPVPGFRFDVTMTRLGEGLFRVRFSQPERARPYLEGDAVWSVRAEPGAVVFDEQINTERALTTGGQPLGGPAPSLRRWLFFRMGHERVMATATTNVASLLSPGQ